MTWPPSKAYTSNNLKYGYRHFVAINYGGEGDLRWVNLVAVLDGMVTFSISWIELNNPELWVRGWSKLSREEANPPKEEFGQLQESYKDSKKSCLHPSLDSGLMIPMVQINLRPWSEEI